MNADLPWDELRYVLAIATRGTLSGAARTLGVHHTTVARRLDALEAQIGARVFDRTPEGFVPTAVGDAFVEAAQDVEARVHDLTRSVAGRDLALSGTVRVTTLAVLSSAWSGLFASFAVRYPEVTVELALSTDTLSLSRREADVALRLTNRPADHLIGRRLVHFDFGPWASRSLVARYGAQTWGPDADLGASPNGGPPLDARPEAFAAWPWLGYVRAAGARLTEAWMQRHLPHARVAARVDSGGAMLDLACAGIGIGILASPIARTRPELVPVLPPVPGFGVDLWALTHPGLRQTARVRAFVDHAAHWITTHVPVEPESPCVAAES